MGYFSGPRVVDEWDARKGIGAGQKSRVMGQARDQAEQYATKQALSQGMAQGPNFGLDRNMVLSQQAGDRRRAMMAKERENPEAFWSPAFGHKFGLYGGIGDAANEAFFESLRGKNVDLGGFGRTVDYDVPTGKSYSRDAGEVAPGMRGAVNRVGNDQFAYDVTEASGPDFKPSRGGWYTPDELAGMDRWQRSRIGYQNSLNRVTRGGY
jgi:hypothetical protein